MTYFTDRLRDILFKFKIRVSFCLMFSALQGCAGIDEIEYTSGEMKDDILSGPLFQLAENLYPNSLIQQNESLETITSGNIDAIETLLNGMMNTVAKLHEDAFDRKIDTSNVIVSDEKIAKAQITKDSEIVIDISVIRSLFKGAVISAAKYNEVIYDETLVQEFELDAENELLRKKLIQVLLDEMKKVRDHPSNNFKFIDLADMERLGENSPLIFFFGSSIRFQDIANRLNYAIFFVLAHEQAHIYLEHFQNAEELSGIQLKDRCRFFFDAELSADLYAAKILSGFERYGHSYFSNHSSTKGHMTFFDEVYHLAGFSNENGHCPIPTRETRSVITDQLSDYKLNGNDQYKLKVIDEAFDQVWHE